MTSTNGWQQPKPGPATVSVFQPDDESVIAPYFAGMRKPERNPLDSAAPSIFAAYPAHSDIGRLVRRGDAGWRLREMEDVEDEICRDETANTAITDRLARQQAEHELNVRYLLQFGVRASERDTFRRILEQTADDGGLSLREAAIRARSPLS